MCVPHMLWRFCRYLLSILRPFDGKKARSVERKETQRIIYCYFFYLLVESSSRNLFFFISIPWLFRVISSFLETWIMIIRLITENWMQFFGSFDRRFIMLLWRKIISFWSLFLILLLGCPGRRFGQSRQSWATCAAEFNLGSTWNSRLMKVEIPSASTAAAVDRARKILEKTQS